MSTFSRVIKNTGFLYIRMGITVFVSLYSTRLVLASLGEVDFGIFNVIGGSIAMMGFLNSTLASATQRFMSYAEGRGIEEHKIKIFNVSLVLHLIVAAVTILLLLAIMPLLFDKILNIPIDRDYTAKIVYLSLIFSTALTIINVPYDAVLNAHENMLYYSVIGIIESLIRLGIAFICVYSEGNRLLTYSVLMALIPVITLTIMKVYCHNRYSECRIAIRKNWDISLVKGIASFSGWNFLTAVSSLFTVQGLSVVLNHFFGTVLNAAQGIATQVNGQLSAFSTNMMKALNPVIVKRTATSESKAVASVTFSGCKFSALLIILFAVPVTIKMQYILSIWLEEVPEWTVVFCQLQLLQTIIVQIATPMATAIYGQGDIRGYAIWKSIMNILPVLLSIFVFIFRGSPIWLYLSLIIFMGIGGDLVIIYYARIKCNLSTTEYTKIVLFPIFLTILVMLTLGLISVLFFPDNTFFSLIVCGLITSIGLILSIRIFGLTNDEKVSFKNLICKFLIRIRKGNGSLE